MVSLSALWLPIVLSAVAVFIASSIVHMALPIHKNDYKKLPDEDGVRAAIRKSPPAPGLYMFPRAPSMKEAASPEMQAKFEEGPVGFMTVYPNGPMAVGKSLVQWFVFTLVLGLFFAYVAGRTLAAGVDYLAVFRLVGSVAFLAYAGGEITDSIWKGQPWANTSRQVLDGLLYALVTAGVFGWLWPAA